MPADQLTYVEPLATAVLAVIAGTDPLTAANRYRIDINTLTDAVEAFTIAGLAALHHPPTAAWHQFGISFPDTATARWESAIAVATALDQLQTVCAHSGWWFLRKPPGWRVRILHADQPAVAQTLEELRTNGVITGWTRGLYEPETTAFGGTTAMATVHELFCADTRGVLNHLRTGHTHIGPREMSAVLIGALIRGAGLDPFETGDIFAKVAALRPPFPQDQAARVYHLADRLRTLLHTPTDPSSPLLAPDGPIPFARAWTDAFHTAGTHLANLATTGCLHRGLRAALAQIVIFHWNRVGLPATTQSILAAAAAQAFIP